MPILKYNKTNNTSYETTSDIKDEFNNEIDRIDKTIVETLKPLEIIVEEQSKTIDELTATNALLGLSNNKLSASNELNEKINNYLINNRELLKNRISILNSKYKICLSYSIITSIIIIIETIFLLS